MSYRQGLSERLRQVSLLPELPEDVGQAMAALWTKALQHARAQAHQEFQAERGAVKRAAAALDAGTAGPAPSCGPVTYNHVIRYLGSRRELMTRKPSSDAESLAEQVAAAFVHRLFPDLRWPAFLTCPDDQSSDTCRAAIAKAAKKKRVKTEVVDLRPDPATRLDQVTARLRDINDRTLADKHPWPTLLILEGFDLLEGSKNDAPTYPFRSRFQFDREHLWLFMGRDWERLCNLFGDRRLPLYRAAMNITPEPWRRCKLRPKS